MIDNILIMIGDSFDVLDMLLEYYSSHKDSKIILCSSDIYSLKEYYLSKNCLIEDLLTTFNTNVNNNLFINTNNVFMFDELTCSIVFCKKIINNIITKNNNKLTNIFIFLKNNQVNRALRLCSFIFNSFINIKIKLMYKIENEYELE